MKRRKILLQVMCGLCLAALLLNLSCAGGPPADNSENKTAVEENPGGEDGKGAAQTDAVPVQVISPARGDISSFMLFSSNVDSEKVVDIFPMTSGIITKIKERR